MKSTLSRRDLLTRWFKTGTVSEAAHAPRVAFSPRGAFPLGDVVVCIFLRGGMDGLSAVVPYGEGGNYYDNRPTLALAEPGSPSPNAARDLDGFFGLHPALSPLYPLYQDGRLAFVHATGSIDPSRSHFDAMRFMEIGVPGNRSVGTGWLGRHLELLGAGNDSPFRAMSFGGQLPESLRSSIPALSLRDLESFRIEARWDQRDAIEQVIRGQYHVDNPSGYLEQAARSVFEAVGTIQSLDPANYQPSGGAVYPDNELGWGLSQVAQIVKADLGLEAACVDLNGWDTHNGQGNFGGRFDVLLDAFARALEAFNLDLGSRMNNITVVAMSEFGRRVTENASAGTDHGHGGLMTVLSGGLTSGQVFADWPGLAPGELDDGDLAITTDYRDVLAELIGRRLLNPNADQVFPGHTPRELNFFVQRT
ncbi:MAG: DUF1501 domain-containing protein [Planctomycetes bacterium]|nr:DUF1501 domain-containing protein [Planctomycetota bacterium]